MVSARARERGAYDVQITHSASGSAVTRDFMLARDPQTQQLAFKHTLIQELVDQQRVSAFSYEHRDPRLDIPAAFESFRYGAGFEDAVDDGNVGFAGYNYSQYVDASWGDRAYLQASTASGGATTDQPVKFLLSSLGFFCIGTRYVYKWGGSSWTAVYDAGAGGLVNDIIEFSNANATYVLVGLQGVGYVYTVDGTYWQLSEAAQAAGSYRASAVATANNSTITIGEPTAAAENDILIASLVTNNTSDYMVPADFSDWKLVARQLVGASSGYLTVWWNRRGASAPSLVFNTSAGGTVQIEAAISAYSACLTVGVPFDAFSQKSNSSVTSHTLTGITTTGSNRRIVGVVGVAASVAITPPGTATERYDTTAGSVVAVESFDQAQAAAGATGDLTATTSASQNSATVLLALKPVANTGASDVSRWAIRGSDSGKPVLWALDSRCNIRSATDPTSKASWSTDDALQIGEVSPSILGLEVSDNVFYLFTARGITSYDGTTVKTVFTSPFADAPSTTARSFMAPDLNVYFTFGPALLQFNPRENTVERLWPSGAQCGNSILNGTITGITASESNVFFTLRNSAGDSYLMKCDPSLRVTLAGQDYMPVHSAVYFGAAPRSGAAISYIKAGANSFSTTNPTVAYGGTNAAGNPVGNYILLPKPTLRPEDDSAYAYANNSASVIYGSNVSFRAQGFSKWLTRIDAVGKTTASETISISYQPPSASSTVGLAVTNVQDTRSTATISPPVAFANIRYIATLATGVSTTSPIFRGAVIHAATNAPRDAGFIFTVSLKDREETNHAGVRTRYRASELEAFLFDGLNSVVTLRDPRGASFTCKVLNLDIVEMNEGADGLETLVEVTLGQLTS